MPAQISEPIPAGEAVHVCSAESLSGSELLQPFTLGGNLQLYGQHPPNVLNVAPTFPYSATSTLDMRTRVPLNVSAVLVRLSATVNMPIAGTWSVSTRIQRGAQVLTGGGVAHIVRSTGVAETVYADFWVPIFTPKADDPIATAKDAGLLLSAVIEGASSSAPTSIGISLIVLGWQYL